MGTIGKNIVIENNQIRGNISLASIDYGPLKIKGNTFTHYPNFGCGIHISAGSSNNNLWGFGQHEIKNNNITCDVGGTGLKITGNNGNIIENNTFLGGDYGLVLQGSQNNIVNNNNFRQTERDSAVLTNTWNNAIYPQPQEIYRKHLRTKLLVEF